MEPRPEHPASTVGAKPFLLYFAEDVRAFPAPEHRYDPITQTGFHLPLHCGGTNRTRSYQNRTSGYGLITGYEDADDEYVTERD